MLKERLQQVRAALDEAAAPWGHQVKLICVSKNHPAEVINPLVSLGCKDIGENRVQEILSKRDELDPNLQIHLIGQLQTNKVKYIIDKVCQIQSVDRMSLALEIDRQAQKHGIVMPVLLQISPVGEPQKGGMAPEEALPFLKEAARLQGLKVQGLMAVMPQTDDEALLRRLFGDMRTLFEQLREANVNGVEMKELSMGMSHDYVLAAQMGATTVRVGSAIFGPRQY
ncbi:MAG: YggS family pyridoxal phosphate-dependent enzyme [Clostridia bacterium]|nr:YggS family pyridoxal phosphate-dependent enzyme [Clostridia bacterium]